MCPLLLMLVFVVDVGGGGVDVFVCVTCCRMCGCLCPLLLFVCGLEKIVVVLTLLLVLFVVKCVVVCARCCLCCVRCWRWWWWWSWCCGLCL